MKNILLLIPLLIIPVILTGLNLINLFCQKQYKPGLIDGLIMILGPILTVILFVSWGTKDYSQALLISELDVKWHTPIASWHLPTVIVLLLLGLVGYAVIRKFQLELPPLLIVLCISCMIISCVIYVISIIHISPHFFEGVLFDVDILYLCIFPINFLISSFTITRKVIEEYTKQGNKKTYENHVLNKCNFLLQNSRNWPVLAILFMIPILTVTLLMLVLFGQQPSAAIKAFTETSDWLLSQKVSPPPIEVDAHYLCTVSLRGHHFLVRPLRYGVRNNTKIIVNRQLCVANAFEQLVQERIPKVHRMIRNIYDKYGYPLSKQIVRPLSADIVYLLMKPIEWIFVIIIYLFDKNPENRIAIQYIPFQL